VDVNESINGISGKAGRSNASNDDICADQQTFEGTTGDSCSWFDMDG